jgi:hypothetical protein
MLYQLISRLTRVTAQDSPLDDSVSCLIDSALHWEHSTGYGRGLSLEQAAKSGYGRLERIVPLPPVCSSRELKQMNF